MPWHAKPSGAYSVDSVEAQDNVTEIYNLLYQTWTREAIAGMCGNMVSESGLNPWRWQSDSVSLTDPYKGYGLVQFTPAYGYINNYGRDVQGFAPNLSTSGILGGNVSDGMAQIIVVDEDRAGKFLNRSKYCTYANISSCYPFSSYKQVNDLWIATVGWLFNYEFPAAAYRTYQAAQGRYANAVKIYEFLGGVTPHPPTPVGSARIGGIITSLRRRKIIP